MQMERENGKSRRGLQVRHPGGNWRRRRAGSAGEHHGEAHSFGGLRLLREHAVRLSARGAVRFVECKDIARGEADNDWPMAIWNADGRPFVDRILFQLHTQSRAGARNCHRAACSFDDLRNC